MMANLEKLQQQNQALTILNTIAQGLNKEVHLEKALNAALQQITKLLQLKTAWIWLFNSDTQMAYMAAAIHLPPIFEQQPELLTGWCWCIEKYLTGTGKELKTAYNISEITCSRLQNLQKGTDGLRYHASVPLQSHEQQKIGILNVVSENSQELAPQTLELLHTIGDMLSIAIERARLFENSRQLGIMQERNRLAREIHDTIAQGLTALSLKLETIEAFLEVNTQHPKIPELVRQSLQLTQSNLEEARRSVLDLRATPLQDCTLLEALENFCNEIKTNHGLQTHFQPLGTYQKLPLRTEMTLYRIAQEAVQNVVKHAAANNLTLQLKYQTDSVVLQVEDDGRGFETATATQGFGLLGISERVKLLKGKMELKSELGVGTVLSVEMPQ
ncbi:MAG: GAF domain-containing sensor histidine kinase [Chitinophagales bacterium]